MILEMVTGFKFRSLSTKCQAFVNVEAFKSNYTNAGERDLLAEIHS